MRLASAIVVSTLTLVPVAASADDAPRAPSAVAAPPAATAPPAAPAPLAPKQEKSWAIDLGAGTQFPISAGAMLTAELPYRILTQLDIGWMPKPYAYTIDALLKAVGSYDDTVSSLLRAALSSSFSMRAAAGWRPFSGHGFEVTAGYSLVTLGGSLGVGDVINVLLQENGSSQQISADGTKQASLHATLHSLQIQLGWRWLLLQDHLVLRASLSYFQTVASSFSVDLPAERRGQKIEEAVSREVNDLLSPYITTYAKVPVLGLSASYRF